MKKHDEGYVLAFVMVVVAVLSLISLAVSTMAVRNVEVQQKAVERMQAKYEAEGAVEIVLTQLDDFAFDINKTEQNAFKEEIERLCATVPDDKCVKAMLNEMSFNKENNGKFTCKIILNIEKNLETVLLIPLEIKGEIVEGTKVDIQAYTHLPAEEDAA